MTAKRRVVSPITISAFAVIERAVEEGVAYGYHRSFKHNDNPSKDHIMTEIERAVMNSLCEVLSFGDDDA